MNWTAPEVIGPLTGLLGAFIGAWVGRRPAQATAAEAIERAASCMVESLHKELSLVRAELDATKGKLHLMEERLSCESNARVVLEHHVDDLNEELRSVRRWAGELHEYALAASMRLTELGETPGDIPVAPMTT